MHAASDPVLKLDQEALRTGVWKQKKGLFVYKVTDTATSSPRMTPSRPGPNPKAACQG